MMKENIYSMSFAEVYLTCPITLLHRRYHRLSPTVFIFVFTLTATHNQCSAQHKRESVLTGFISPDLTHPRFLLACSLPYLIFLVHAPVHKTTYVRHNPIWNSIHVCPGVPSNDNCSKLYVGWMSVQRSKCMTGCFAFPHHYSLPSLFYSASPKSCRHTHLPTTTFGPRSSNGYLSPCLLSVTCIPSFNMNARWGWSIHKRFAGLV